MWIYRTFWPFASLLMEFPTLHHQSCPPITMLYHSYKVLRMNVPLFDGISTDRLNMPALRLSSHHKPCYPCFTDGQSTIEGEDQTDDNLALEPQA